MIILGLTGSIGMGKSTATAFFRRLGVPVFDADAAVHALQGPRGAALPMIEAAFPGTTTPKGVDRQKLGAAVFGNPEALQKLEAILHPLVRRLQQDWLSRQARQQAALVVLDVPLLFEKGGWRQCDAIAVVSAPLRIQRQRVLKRLGMTAQKFDAICKIQTPDRIKRRHADFVIPSGRGKRAALIAIRHIIASLENWTARHWPPGSPGYFKVQVIKSRVVKRKRF